MSVDFKQLIDRLTERYSVSDIAEQVGVSESYIYKIKDGSRVMPSYDIGVKLINMELKGDR